MNNILEFLVSATDFSPTEIKKQTWRNETFSYADSARPNHGIILVTEGQIAYRMKDSFFIASPGDVVFLPKGSYYSISFPRSTISTCDYLINFDSNVAYFHHNTPTILINEASFSIESQFKKLVSDRISGNTSQLRIRGEFYFLLDEITKLTTRQNSPAHWQIIHKAQNLIQENDELSISDIAKSCCTSESSLRRLFKESLGISPTKYKISIKLNKAKYLLESSDMSICEISDKLNFFDTPYFCKIFTKHEGITPSMYRKSKRL